MGLPFLEYLRPDLHLLRMSEGSRAIGRDIDYIIARPTLCILIPYSRVELHILKKAFKNIYVFI